MLGVIGTKNRNNSIFSRITSCYIVLMLTVYLFLCGAGGYQEIFSAKLTGFLVITGGYVAASVVLLLEMRIVGGLNLPKPQKLLKQSSLAQRLVLLYMVLTWISGACSPYAEKTLFGVSRGEGVVTISLYCLAFLLVSSFGRVESWMLPLLAVVTLGFDLLCIIQLHGGNPFMLYPAGYNYFDAYTYYSGAYLGTIGNVDLVAAFLCLVIPIFWIAMIRQRGRKRWLLLLPLGTSLYALGKMSVLAGVVGVGCGALVTLPVVAPLPVRTRKRMGIALLLAAICLLAAVYVIQPASGLLYEVHELLHGRVDENFGTGRIHIWKNVLSLVPDHLILGHGPDTMLLADIPGFSRFDEHLGILIESKIDVAHSEYLNILFHQGTLALVAYVGALLAVAWRWVKTSSQDGTAAALGGAVLCYCIQACFGFSMCITAPYFWIVFGLLENRNIERNGGIDRAKKTH